MMKHARPPTLGEVIELRQRMPNSLESRAASINRHIDLFSRAAGAWQAHRVRAGFELIAARKEVSAQGIGWEAWCADNIHRSMGDIRKMMQMAGADDPEAAAAEERTKAREGMRTHRANVSAVDRLFQDFLQLDEEQKVEFFARVKKEMER